MTGDPLTRLTEALEAARAAGVEPDLEALAAEHGLSVGEVRDIERGLAAMQDILAEPASSTALPAPDLPEDLELGVELGRGGMGIVYRAHQRSLDREVAVKVLRPGELVFGEALARFRREVRALAKLRHPHIVTIHEVGESGGHVYYVMDLFEKSLADLLAQKRRPMPIARVARLVEQVASAVSFVHAHGLIHRDLKPANVLLDEVGDAYVADFGLAVDPSEGATLTATGNLLGTPDYMAPEQALGDRARVSERTDVYALGTILYQCLTGRTPFAGRALVDKIHAVAHERPPAPRKLDPSVPRDLERVCLKAMAKDPDERYATAKAFAEDLQRFMDGRPVEAQAPSAWSRVRGAFRRQGRSLALASAAAGAALAFGWWGLGWGNSGASKLASADLLWERGEYRAAGVLYEQAEERIGASADGAVAFHLADRRGRALLLELAGPMEDRAARVEALRRTLVDIGDRVRFDEERRTLHELHRVAAAEYLSSPPVGLRSRLDATDLLRSLVERVEDPLHAAACVATLRRVERRYPEGWFSHSPVPLDRLALGSLRAYPSLDEQAQVRVREFFTIGLAQARARDEGTLEEFSHSLADLVEDRTRDESLRALAATGLAALHDLPFVLVGAVNHEPVWDEVLAAESVRLWRDGRGLGLLERWRQRVEAALDALPRLAELNARSAGAGRVMLTSRTWLWRRGAPDRGPEESLRSWWAGISEESHPRVWIANALGLEGVPEPAALVPQLQDFERAGRVHTLLSLLVTSGTPVPDWPVTLPQPTDLDVRWARTLGFRSEPNEVELRLALAVVPDGVGRLEWIEEWRVPLRLAGEELERALEFELVEYRPSSIREFFGSRLSFGETPRRGGRVEVAVQPEYRDGELRLGVRGDVSWRNRNAHGARTSVPLEAGSIRPLLHGLLTWSDHPSRAHDFLLMATFGRARDEVIDWASEFQHETRTRLEQIVADPNRRSVTGGLEAVTFEALTLLPDSDLLPALDALHGADPEELSWASSNLEALLAARLACGGGNALPPRGKVAESVERGHLHGRSLHALANHPDHEARRWVSRSLPLHGVSYDRRVALLAAWRDRDLPQELAWLREAPSPPARWRDGAQIGGGLALAALLFAALRRWPRRGAFFECAAALFAGACFGTNPVTTGLQAFALTLFAALAWGRARQLGRAPVSAVFCLLSVVCWTAAHRVALPGLHAGAALFLLCAVAGTPWLVARARPLVGLIALVAIASRAASTLALATDALGIEDWSLLLRIQDHRLDDLLDGAGTLAFFVLLVVMNLAAPVPSLAGRPRAPLSVGT